MKKFTFTLQPLLHIKQAVEKQERNTLGLLTRRLNMLTEARDRMTAEREAASAAWSSELETGMTASDTERYTSYFRMMKDQLEAQTRQIAAVNQEIEACRKRLVEILREIHMFETLREKQYRQYLAEVQAEEERAIGDFVSFQSTNKPAG